MSEMVLGWHFLSEDRHTRRGVLYPPPVLVEVGQTLTETRPLRMCRVGLHASERAIDALRYAPGPVACRVKLSGEVWRDTDKLCASERTCLAMADATHLLHEFACWCAEEALLKERQAGREPHPDSWAAIEAKRRWLRGEINDEQLAAALDAAGDAAWAARDAAWDAAWDAGWDAAWDAAWAARDARDARDAGWDAAAWAAGAAAWAAQNTELERRLKELLGINE